MILTVTLFSVISVANAVATPVEPEPLPCTDGLENADYSCNGGANFDDDFDPITLYVQVYGPATATVGTPIIPYRGVSLAGGEFSSLPPQFLAQAGEFIPYDDDAAIFIYKGMNTFRIPITWEYFADINGQVNAQPNYLNKLTDVITKLGDRNATIIIDVHNYMRYNPSNVVLNTVNANPYGKDVIGLGTEAPTTQAFALLWSNIVGLYHAPRILYGIMNEPHNVSFDLLVKNTNAALQAIRLKERELGLSREPHLVLVSGNNWTGLHTWFNEDGFCNGNDALFLDRLVDPAHHFAIEIHQYFDTDSSGTYVDGQCVPSLVFNATFDAYWALFAEWSSTRGVGVLLGEFGAIDTEVCRSDVSHLLDAFTAFNQSIGWVVWAGGNSWGGTYPLSVAPAGKVNAQIWNHLLYENYLVAVNPPLPPLSSEKVAIRVINNSSERLFFQGGYLPFEFEGSADMEARGGVGILYSNNQFTTPTGGLQIKYTTANSFDPLGFGIAPPKDGFSYSYGWNNSGGIVFVFPLPASQCDIVPDGPGANKGETRCFIVINK
jgi:endoglucanase